MLPAAQTYQVSANGDSGAPLFQDVGTRVLQTVRIGENAGKLGAGPQNVFAGYEAGREARSVTQTVCIGYQAGAATYGTTAAVFIGAFAGAANQGGSESVFVGFSAGQTNRYGDTLTAVGAYAMRENYSGSRSTAVGYRAMERNLNGDDNTAVGAEAFQGLRSGNRNTATGFRAGRGAQGDENVFNGAYAGYSNSRGDGNCFVGYRSGEFLADGSYNVGVGLYTLQSAYYASCNVAIGPFAGAYVGNSIGSVIIGAFAGASNTDASSNVIVGSGAGASATGNESVIIGADAARNAGASRLVVIGAQAAHDIRAEGSVIIGYGAADNLIYGGYNVMIGPGANTYTASNTNGICIGTQNVFASDYTVSIGEEIQNKRSRSILVGFSLQSDANNSVILGNEITLQSVLFFKDPISQDFAEAVRADAITKFGISNIAYGTSNQLLVSPDGASAFLYGTAGLLTSNTFSTATTVVDAGVSPNDYDLRAYIAGFGSNYVLLRPRALAVRSNADLAAVVSFSAAALSNVYSETGGAAAGGAGALVYGQPPVATPAGAALATPSPVNSGTSNLTLGDALYVNDMLFETTNFPTLGGTVANFYARGATSASLDFPVAKRARTPFFAQAESNLPGTLRSRVNSAGSGGGASIVLSPGLAFSNEIGFTGPETGVDLLDAANLAAYASPAQRGALAQSNAFAYRVVSGSGAAFGAVSSATGSLTYTPYPEAAYAAADAITIEPILQVQGYGVPPAPGAGASDGSLTFSVTAATDFAASNLLVADRVTLHAESNAFPFGAAHLLAVPALGPTTPLRFTEISAGLVLNVAPSALASPYAPSGTYTSNALSNMVAQQMDVYSDFNLAAHIAAASNLNAATVAKNAAYIATYVLSPLGDFSNETVSLSNALVADGVTDAAYYTDLAAIRFTADGLAGAWTAMTFPPPSPADWTALVSLKNDWFSAYDPVPRQYLDYDTAMTAALDTINSVYILNDFQEYNSNVLLYRDAAAAATQASAPPATLAAANAAFDAFYAVHLGPAQAIVSGYPYGDPPDASEFATTGARDAVLMTELLHVKYRDLAATTPSTRLFLTYGDLVAGRVSFSNAAGGAGNLAAGSGVTLAVQFPQQTAPALTAPDVAGPFTVPIYQYSPVTWTGFPYANTQLTLTLDAGGSGGRLVGDRYDSAAASAGIPMSAASNAAGAIAAATLPTTGAVYIVAEPQRGTLVRAGSQLSNVRYIPNDPWPAGAAGAAVDRFTLIAAAPGGPSGAGETTTVSVVAETPAAVPGSAAWIAAPPAAPADPVPVPAPARQWELAAFAGIVHDFTQFSYTPCNIDVTRYTYNGGPIATTCNIAPLAAYYPADGFHVRTSNIAETSNITSVVSPPAGGLGYGQINVTYNFLETVNQTSMDDVTTEVSVTSLTFTPTFSNVLYPDETSNIAVSWTSVVNDVNRRAYDSIARYHAYDYSNIAYATYEGHWLASNETFLPATSGPGGGPLLFSYETRAGDGPLLYNATCNYTFMSNIVQRDPYFQLNRHYLYKPAPEGDDARIRYGPTVADGAVVLGVALSNTVGRTDGLVAPSATFTQADVNAGRIYVRLAGGANVGGSLSLSVTGLGVGSGGAGDVAAAPAAIAVQTLSTSNALPLTARVVASTLAPIAISLDDNFRSATTAELGDFLLPANNAAYASLAGLPAPTRVTFKPYDADTPDSVASNLAAGYFLYAPTGERRLTYELADLSNVRYATAGPDARIRADRVAFYYSAGAAGAAADSNVYVANLALLSDPTSHGQDLNVGLTVAPGSNLLTAAAFHHSRDYAPPSTLGVKLLNTNTAPYDDIVFSETEFTMDDVAAGRISVTVNAEAVGFGAGATFTLLYDLYANLSDISARESGLTFPIRVYKAHQFPRLEDWAAPSNALRQSAYGEAATDAELAGSGVRVVGPVWDTLSSATIQGSAAGVLSNMFIDVLTPTARGFLHATATTAAGAGCNVLQSLSVTNLFGYGANPAASNVRYVPYDPAQQENAEVFGSLRLGDGSNAVSAPFALPLQNYLARFGGAATSPYGAGGAVNVGLRDDGARTVALNEVLPRSAGLVADGYVWRREGARADLAGESWLPALNAAAPETRVSLVSTAANAYGPAYTPLPGASNLLYAPKPYGRSERAAFTGGIIETTIDQCDRVSLRDDIGGAGEAGAIAATVTSNVSEIQSLTYYVTGAPQYGVLYSAGGGAGAAAVSVAAFTDADLAANRIFYQHSGSATSNELSDEIRLAVATTPYDVSSNELQLRFTVRPLPRVSLDTEAFVYASNVASAFASRFTVADHLTIAPPASFAISEITAADYGYVHPIASNAIAFVPNGTFSGAPDSLAAARYRYTALAGNDVPTNGSVDFIVNNRTDSGTAGANAIAQDAFYGPMFLRKFASHLNEFRHSNALAYPPPIQDSNQTLEYTINPDSVGASNFAGRIVSVGLQVQPSQGLSVPPYTDWLNTYEFSVIFRANSSGGGGGAAPAILGLNFSHSNIAVVRDGAPVANIALPADSGFRFAFGQWGNMTIYNRDPDNDNDASLYINADLFTTKEARVARNVLQGLSVTGFEFADVGDIEVTTALTGASNYYADLDRSLVAVPDAGGDALGQTFRLTNYATSLYFRNLEIAATTYDYTASGASGADVLNADGTTVHNVIVGRDVIVRGVNNICIGNRFSTSGANSIILGNDIGILVQTSDVGVGQINDIYESIIIGNNSYQNSIVRNIISVGREIFNDLYLAPLTSVNAFLSQKPIVIGNNITTASLDYHINVGNTFLKTTIGGPQIYLGTEREVVAIGYTSNAYFTPAAALGGTGPSGQSGPAVTRPLVGSSSNALYVNGGVYAAREIQAGHALIAPARRLEAVLDVDGPGGIGAAAYAGLAVGPGDLLLATGAIYTNPLDADVSYPYVVFTHHAAAPAGAITAACLLGVLAAPAPTPHPADWAPTAGAPLYGLQIVAEGIAAVRVYSPGAAVNLGDYVEWEPGVSARATVQAAPRDRATAIARALETVAAPVAPETTVLVRCQLWF